jgi:asparagine synthase (glutamine-hydrolysing)
MCGIAGAVDRTQSDNRTDVVAQLRTLDHRGPDSWGIFDAAGAAIGQTRLAIIDLKTGDPPISNEDHSVGAVLNGEIYNFKALRAELSGTGHHLSTQGDTEVIAHLAEDLEPVVLARRLHGMFAFAVWDDRRQRLILGRDRLGKKPLYYWSNGGRLVFGSEIKAVLAHPAVPRQLDPRAVPAYLTFGYVPSPSTFFEGIHSVPPGHVLVFDSACQVRLEPYWAPEVAVPPRSEPLDVSLREAADQVRARLTRAVEHRLIADVPLGAFLSGGIDSSTIVAIMAGVSDRPVRTFTIGFEDSDGFDERPYARVVAERFGTDHVEFVVAPNAIDLIERLVWHHDQPFGDSSAIPTYLLAEVTRRDVTVALCGDGGDELFAGYERFSAGAILDRFERPLALVRAPVRGALSLLPDTALPTQVRSFSRFLAASQLGLPDAFMTWVSMVPRQWRERLLGTAENWATADYRRVWDGSDGADVVDRLLDLNLRTYLLDDLLPKVDRMAMAHGLEVRSPFLDHDLVEFALKLPRQAKTRGMSRKRVLKLAFADLLPEAILNRPKRGFGVPLDRWFRSDLKGYLATMLGAPDARARAHVAPDGLDALISEHQSGNANHGHALWTLLTLEVFLRREGW